jgi:hypothetical protein
MHTITEAKQCKYYNSEAQNNKAKQCKYYNSEAQNNKGETV